MTPDEWVSSPDGQAVRDAMRAAWDEDWDPGDIDSTFAAVLLAALRVRHMTPCPAGCDKGVANRSERPNGGWVTVKCPTCAGAGVVPGVPVLVDALMERHDTCHVSIPLYRVRVPGAAQ